MFLEDSILLEIFTWTMERQKMPQSKRISFIAITKINDSYFWPHQFLDNDSKTLHWCGFRNHQFNDDPFLLFLCFQVHLCHLYLPWSTAEFLCSGHSKCCYHCIRASNKNTCTLSWRNCGILYDCLPDRCNVCATHNVTSTMMTSTMMTCIS